MRGAGCVVAVAALALAACASEPNRRPQTGPAKIERGDLGRVQTILRASYPSITFGLPDGTTSSVLVMRPPAPSPQENMSLAMPVVFDILIDGDGCYLDRRDTSETIRLPDVRCSLLPRRRR